MMTDEVSPDIINAVDDHTAVPVIITTAADASTSTTNMNTMTDNNNADGEPERCCWICFATDEDNRMAAWLKPCKCRGTTKWVHQSCLYRWIDEKLNDESTLRAVACPQCQTEYIIVFPKIGKFGRLLEALDTLLTRICPFLTAGIVVCSLYWTAATFGAITFLQVMGHDTGMAIMKNGDPLFLLIGLPCIPVGLILSRLIRWEDALFRMFRRRRMEEELQQQGYIGYPDIPVVSENVSGVRIFCGAIILPTMSSIVGKILFDSVKNTFHRTLLGGLTYITVKGFLKIYLRHRQLASRRNRRILDYSEENVRTYKTQNRNNNNNTGNANGNNDAGQLE